MGKVISIVINDNHMRLAVLSNGKRRITVSYLLMKEVPEGMIEDGTIRDAGGFSVYLTDTLKDADIKVRHVMFSLASDRIITREVVLPELNEEKLELTIKANAPEYFPMDLGSSVLAYFPIAKILNEDEEKGDGAENKKKRYKKQRKSVKPGRQLRLMVLAAPDVMVQSYYDVARLSHLKLDSIDYTGNSLFRLIIGQIGEMPCLLIRLNSDSGVLTIIHHRHMVLQRSVHALNTTVFQAVTDRVYHLISDIRRVMEYYAGRSDDSPLEQIYLLGKEAEIEGLDMILSSQLNLPVEIITDLKRVCPEAGAEISMSEILGYADNIGAAIAPVHFMPKKFEERMSRKREAGVYRLTLLLALFVSAVLITIPATRFFAVGTDVLELENRLLITEDVKPVLKKYKEAELRYADVQAVQKYVRTNNESLPNFITVFEQLRPSNLSITSFSCKEGEINFTALASGKKTVAKLIQQLDLIANVSEVKVSGLSGSFTGDSETVTFSASCRLTNEDVLLQGRVEEIAEEITAGGAGGISVGGAAGIPGEDQFMEDLPQ